MARVRGTLSVYFENFTFELRDCDTAYQGIWLMFGGDVPGIVPSTVNDNFRNHGKLLGVNGATYGINKDENFRRLYALIAARRGNLPAFQVTATLTGAFYAGVERNAPNGQTRFGGYGHLWCCSLFVITAVSDVESVPPANLNLRGTVTGPDGKPARGISVLDDILGGSPPERQLAITNEYGEFAFSISGQLLRIENPNYRPLALPVEPGAAPIDVKLEDAAHSDWVVPFCASAPPAHHRIGFSVLFALPSGMKSKSDTIDFGKYFSVFPRGHESISGDLIISNRTDSIAEDFPVDSEWSEQRWIKDSAGRVIGIDSWGQLKRGGRWRAASFLGNSIARYELGAGEQPVAMDTVINSACNTKP